MDIAVGDTIQTRKNTRAELPASRCSGSVWISRSAARAGGREVMLPRAKIEKNIKKVLKPGAAE